MGVDWSAIVLLAYLGLGAPYVLVALVPRGLSLRLLSARAHPAVYISAEIEAARERSRLAAVRATVDGVLTGVAQLVVWPVTVSSFARAASLGAVAQLRAKRPLDVQNGIVLLAFAAFVTLVVGLQGHHWYVRLACYAVIAATLANQLRLVVNGVDAREELRRTIGNPALQLALVAVTNFLALTCAAYVLLRWRPGAPFDWEDLRREGVEIAAFGHLSAIWSARHSDAARIFVAVAGLSVYAMLVNQLKNPLQLRRTDADRIELAIRLTIAGDLDAARRWLQSVDQRDELSPEGVRASGMLALAEGELAAALVSARAAATLRRVGTDAPEDDDDARDTVLRWAVQFRDPELLDRVVAWLVDDGISDACLAAALIGLADETVRRIDLPPDAYQLSHAVIDIRARRWSDARRRVAASRPASLAERVGRRLVAAYPSVADSDMRGPAGRREAAVADTRMLLNESSTWRLDRMPVWLRTWLTDDIDARLRKKRLFLDAETSEPLRELRDALVRRHANRPGPLRSHRLAVTPAPGVTTVGVRGIGAVEVLGGSRRIWSLSRRHRVYRHDIRYQGRVHPVFVYVERAAAAADPSSLKRPVRSMVATHGRTALEAALRRGRIPKRIFIGSEGVVHEQVK